MLKVLNYNHEKQRFEFIETNYETIDDAIDTWTEALPSFTHPFLQDSRQTFIPYGDICYLDWDYENEYDEESNTLQFSCSLKNYNSTIGKFIDFLPRIADEWDLESLYEECEPSESTHYSNKE